MTKFIRCWSAAAPVAMVIAAWALGMVGCGGPDRGSGGGSPDRADASANGGAANQRVIAVIPKGTTQLFWTSVEAGAKRAGAELGINIIWKGPIRENDRAQQIQVVQQFIADRVDGIVLAPLDSKALLGSVKAAARKKIPVVIFDSALDGEMGTDFVSFVATDNRRGGQLGGEKLAELLGGQGKVVLLRYMAGSASTDNRETGFEAAIAAHEGIEIILKNRYAGATASEAQTAALNMMDQVRRADGVFCPNESSTNGMLQALRKENLAGKIKFVGFDASPPLVEALRNGEIDALVVQNPRKMGYLGVQTLATHLEGGSVGGYIDTGVAVVTRQNLGDPEIRPLLE